MAGLHQALGLLQDDAGDLDVALGGLVKCGGDDLCVDAAGHVGHLLGALVDEQHYYVCVGVVGGDGVGDVLEQDGLAGLGRGDDERTLTLADGSEHVDYARGDVAHRPGGDVELLLGEEGGEVLEGDAVAHCDRVLAVYTEHFAEGKVLIAVAGRIDGAFHHIAGLECILLYVVLRHVDVVGAGQVVVIGGTEEAEAFGHKFEHAGGVRTSVAGACRAAEAEPWAPR